MADNNHATPSIVGVTQPHSGNDQGSRIRGMIKAAVDLLVIEAAL